MIEGLKIVVDWETVDAIMEANLLHSIHTMKQDVKRLKATKKLKSWQKEDLEHFEKMLVSLTHVAEYYIFDFNKKVKKYAKQQL
jgi:hypothetical protein